MIKNDQTFDCINCQKRVPKLKYTSRNHCPYCLHSLHVDIVPGDRANDCRGLLVPVAIETSAKKGYIIVYKCQKCGETGRNKSANDDDFDKILEVAKQSAKNVKF
jgi:DNA-directed RNA polymerase subunit RPC12/RpoP